MAPDKVSFIAGGAESLGAVEGMWRRLTADAARHSVHFTGHFAEKRWEDRVAELTAKAAKGALQVDVARAGPASIGYCVSSVVDGAGEIESLFVEPGHRGMRVGESLVRRAVDWMKASGAETMVVLTVYGNDGVLPFYARQGFRPISVVLKYDGRDA